MKIELFKLNIERLILRFYLFMTLIFLGGFTGVPWSLTIAVGMVVFLSGLLGVSFHNAQNSGKKKQMLPGLAVRRQNEQQLPARLKSAS